MKVEDPSDTYLVIYVHITILIINSILLLFYVECEHAMRFLNITVEQKRISHEFSHRLNVYWKIVSASHLSSWSSYYIL
jgi:hypothetical protein